MRSAAMQTANVFRYFKALQLLCIVRATIQARA